MKFEIKNRLSGEVVFTAEIECDENDSYGLNLGLAVKIAVSSGADLSDADLRGADLSDADLGYSNLRGADLGYSNLSDADLRGADLRGADLGYSNLHGADLGYSNLHGADLRDADLGYSNLRGADLGYSNLRDADLSGANLRDADLSDADLRDADLLAAVGNKEELHSMQLEKYDVCFGFGVMQIGCQRHSIGEWMSFSDERIESMDNGALKWWSKWKDFIFMAIEKCEANK